MYTHIYQYLSLLDIIYSTAESDRHLGTTGRKCIHKAHPPEDGESTQWCSLYHKHIGYIYMQGCNATRSDIMYTGVPKLIPSRPWPRTIRSIGPKYYYGAKYDLTESGWDGSDATPGCLKFRCSAVTIATISTVSKRVDNLLSQIRRRSDVLRTYLLARESYGGGH